MARGNTWSFRAHTRKKRKGVHSKNASVGQTGYKKKYRGQGRQCPKRVIVIPKKYLYTADHG